MHAHRPSARTRGMANGFCEDQRRRTRRGPIAPRVTDVVYNMHFRHLHSMNAHSPSLTVIHVDLTGRRSNLGSLVRVPAMLQRSERVGEAEHPVSHETRPLPRVAKEVQSAA
jgi:hypothetical protein